MFFSALFALTIAFPRPGLQIPYVEKCYLSGAVDRGVTNILVQGKDVSVYRTGGWVTMVDLKEGKNTIKIDAGYLTTNYVISVAKKSAPSAAANTKKIEYKTFPNLLI